MADVTGPISTLPNSRHDVPDGTKCDEHSDRDAVARVQGETDSFGCEMHDMCEECVKEHNEYLRSPEAEEERHGRCDWCHKDATDLRDARDYEEGMSGRVYRVCGACVKRTDEDARRELGEHDYYGGED
jgi:hypothetical protein